MQPSGGHKTFENVEALTFDLYGTLVDWEAVWTKVAGKFLAQYRAKVTPQEFCNFWKAECLRLGNTKYERYASLLRKGLGEAYRRYGINGSVNDSEVLLRSWGEIGPFPDVEDALRRLKRNFRVCIISNTDNNLIDQVLPHLRISFDEIITAEDLRAYKPALKMYRTALEQLACKADHAMHVARSQYDVVGSKRMGMWATWVNRAEEPWQERDAKPDLEVKDIKDLADQLLP